MNRPSLHALLSRLVQPDILRRAVTMLLGLFTGLRLMLPVGATAQALDLHDAIRSVSALTNTVVTMTGRAELRVGSLTNPLPGSTIHLNSPDAWLLFESISPSQVASTLLSRVRVNGAAAVIDGNVRVVQFANGAMVIPHGSGFSPFEVFSGRYFTGSSKKLESFVAYDALRFGATNSGVGSFRLKRGYMATLAQMENGSGFSRNYVAQDGDLEVSRLPSALETNLHYVRVFPWRWTGKKGVAGNIESGLNVKWLYNWNLDRSSALDWEYTPIRQTRWWPGLDQDWRARGSTHLLGYNEPDRPDQANLSVADAIGAWPDVLWPGLRVGAPAVSDGGLSWLYDFIAQADAAGLRVDFVPVHYYRCYGNAADPAGAANQFYNFLKGIYDVVKRPLWITEWNNGANWTTCADPSFAQQEATVAAILDMLDSTPFVERYAIYNWVEDVRRVKWDDGSLTAAGVVYRDQNAPLAYRQEMADAGVGSSARYSFDRHANDEWGNGQDAMLVGAPNYTAGRYSEAIALNGATDYLQVSPRLGDSTDFSFAGWVLWNGGGSWQRIFDFGDDATHYLFLSPRSAGGSLRFAINNGGGEQQLSGPALPTNVWTHVAVTISGSTGKLFVNGAPVATNTGMSINPGDVGTKYNYLGRSRFPADPLFGGRFDDFRFVSSALTDAQVAAIYSTPPPKFTMSHLHKPDAVPGQLYNASIAGGATGIGALTFAKMDGPAWLSVAADGSLLGTPGTNDGGLNQFFVRVSDTNGSMHTAKLFISVPSLSLFVTASADDAEQSAAGAVTLGSTDLELVRDDGTSSGNQIVGLRFNGLMVPQGAIITNAVIQFTADEAQNESAALNIAIETADHAAGFTTASNNLGSRAVASLTVPWTPTPWTAGESGMAQRTPNLAGLVQEVISRPGWDSGNAIAFLISGSGHRTADASDKAGGVPPRLLIGYTTPTPVFTLSRDISNGASDAEESAGGVVTLNSTDLELVNDGALGDQTVGLRFENISLPQGAIVVSAAVQFSADEAQSEATSLSVRGQATDNATAFLASANNLSARPLTTAFVPWVPVAWESFGERGPRQRTPDLATVVQEIVSRPGWSPGNAMAFLFSGSGHRTSDAADEVGGLPATLSVNYRLERPLGSYTRWAAARPEIISPADDLDGDGYENFVEYALGLNPLEPDAQVVTVDSDASAFRVIYVRPVDVLDASYQVEWTVTLGGTWNRSGITQQIIHDDGVRRTIRATIPKGAATRRFLRLKVTALE